MIGRAQYPLKKHGTLLNLAGHHENCSAYPVKRCFFNKDHLLLTLQK